MAKKAYEKPSVNFYRPWGGSDDWREAMFCLIGYDFGHVGNHWKYGSLYVLNEKGFPLESSNGYS